MQSPCNVLARIVLGTIFSLAISGVLAAQQKQVSEPAAPRLGPKGKSSVSIPYTGAASRLTTSGQPQNETAIAVDPSNPLVLIGGFNDYRLGTGFGGQGVVTSSDGGATWTDRGMAIAMPTNFTNSGGDPGIAFDSNGRAYYCHLASGAGASNFTRNNGVFVASSTNGGASWGTTVAVASNTWPATGTVPFEDKPFVAADEFPASPYTDRVYVSWTRFYDGNHPNDGATGGGDILFSRSTDNGATWSAPLSLTDSTLQPGNGGTGTAGTSFVQGSEPEVAANGDVYVCYRYGGRVDVSRSTDGGTTFAAPTQPFGTSFSSADVASPLPNETFRVNAFPNIETDPTRPGNVYVVAANDPDGKGVGSDGGDIIFSRSTDNGATWGATVTLNDDGLGKNQIFPWMAVDPITGNICVIWYDTRLDAGNHDLDVFGTFSFDGGVNFTSNVRFTDNTFDPDTAQFMGNSFFGDYNGLAAGGNVFHALWTDASTGEQEIFYGSKNAGGPLDIFIIVDLSGSFIDDLAEFKTQASGIISSLTASNPDTKFGLARFEDYPIAPYGSATLGDSAYTRVSDLTTDTATLLTTISGLSAVSGAGADGPQSQLPALYQAATGAGQTVPGYPAAGIPAGQQANFRDGAVKLFLLWTDASFHNPGDPGDPTGGYPGPSFNQTVAAIAALDPPKVLGILSGSNAAALADLKAMANATGALAPTGGVDCDNDNVIDILEGEPLVCPIAASGVGIFNAVVSIVEAVPRPPFCHNGGPYTVECQGGTTSLKLKGTGSYDPDGDSLSYLWTTDCPGASFDDPTSVTPTLTIDTSSGTGLVCNVTLKVTVVGGDPEETSSCPTTVTVVDTTPPTIDVTNQTIKLWPPNHKYATVKVEDCVLGASDVCDSTVGVGSVTISKVSSDEPEDALGNGDGKTLDDIVISNDCRSVLLRKERAGGSNGRVYTITFTVSDAAGNTSTATCKVGVPIESELTATDDGPSYTVHCNK